MRTPRYSPKILDASDRVCAFIADRQGLDASVAEMAQAVGLNERTFYRYFATKEGAVRPVLDWGATIVADRLRSQPDRPVRDAVAEALAEVLLGEHRERTRRLFPVIFAEPALRAVLLAVYHDAEEEVRAALAERAGIDPGADRLRFDAAHIVGATRVALEIFVGGGTDPIRALEPYFDRLPAHLFGDEEMTFAERAVTEREEKSWDA